MKQFVLAVALIGATATTTFAQQQVFPAPPTAAAVQAGKQSMIAKTGVLQAAVNSHNTTKAEAVASQILRMMRTRVGETRNTAEALTGTQKDAMMQRMLMMEGRVKSFMDAAKDVKTNGASLVAQAQTFTSDY